MATFTSLSAEQLITVMEDAAAQMIDIRLSDFDRDSAWHVFKAAQREVHRRNPLTSMIRLTRGE